MPGSSTEKDESGRKSADSTSTCSLYTVSIRDYYGNTMTSNPEETSATELCGSCCCMKDYCIIS